MIKTQTMRLKKLPFTLLWLCLFVCSTISAQDYQIGEMHFNFIDSSRNRTIPVDIYYPADVAGNTVPFPAGNTDQFPPIVFGHGFVMTVDAYDYIWQTLVPKGYVIIFPKTEGGILPSHLEFGKDLAYAMSEITNLNLVASSVFYQRISSVNAIMGHSMGGGASFLAAQLYPSITTLVSLAPAETNPSAIAAAGNLTIPSLIFAGSNDCVTPSATNQMPMHEAMQSGCKTYVNILGGSHCQMADSNFLCQLGEATCSPSAEISREEQHQILIDYILPWLQAQLKQDCVSGAAFNELIASDDRTTFDKNCEQCEVLAVSEMSQDSFEMYPNPFDDRIAIKTINNHSMILTLYDIASRVVFQKQIANGDEMAVAHLESGIYLYTIVQSGKMVKTGKLVKR